MRRLARIIKRFSRSMVFTVILTIVAFAIFYFSPHQTIFSALVFSLRLFAVISSTSTFFLTTTPDELEHVMKWLHLPSDFVMVFVIAVRFIPVLMLDALQIMDAQRARGLEFDKGNFVQRIRNTIPVFVPLIAVALNRSLDLAEAMDSRAYGAYSKPTSLYTSQTPSIGLSCSGRDLCRTIRRLLRGLFHSFTLVRVCKHSFPAYAFKLQ